MRRRQARSTAIFRYSAAIVLAVTTVAVSTTVTHAASTLAMCGNTGTAPAIKHVVVMYLENQGYDQVIGNPSAPYMNNTLTARCGVATEMYAATHASAANYLATTAGQYPAKSPQGCGSVVACSSSAPSLFSQSAAADVGWRNFVEGATSNCEQATISGVTKIGHDPGLFYPDVDCAADVVPVNSLTTPDSGAFWSALDTNALPGFTWLSPSQDHVGEVGSPLSAQDGFLSQFLPKFVASASYQSGTTALIITDDEGSGADSTIGENCTNQTADLAGKQQSCHVPLWVVYPYNHGGTVTTFLDPYSITKGVEDLLGRSHLAHAADAGTNSLVGHFGLSTPNQNATATSALCGSMAGQTPHISKVLWIVMENLSYGTAEGEIPGDPSASYIDNSLLSQCGSASDYHAATHPSYPNYLAMTSGSTQGVASDSLGYYTAPSIFSQTDPSWRSYEEYMPTSCDHIGQTGTAPPSQYYLGRHNPAASFSALPVGAPSAGDCASNDVPLGTTTSGPLLTATTGGSLPAFSFVTPGPCDDMHALPAGDTSCPNLVAGGDAWLAKWIPILTSGPDYEKGDLLIDITWDEGRGGSDGESCTSSSATDCIVPDIVISPYTTHVVSGSNYSHYSLLKTTEELLGLPLLGHAADASTADLCGPFGICSPSAAPPTPTSSSSVAFAGASGDTADSAAPSVTIPSTAAPGDELLLTATAVATTPIATPPGWTLVGTVPNPVMTTSVWSKFATSADPGTTVSVHFPAAVKGSLQVAAYAGVSPSVAPALAGATAHQAESAVTTPSVAVPVAGDVVVSYWAVKSSDVTAWAGSPGATIRSSELGNGGVRISALLADSAPSGSAGSGGGLTATANDPFTAATTLSLVLTP